MAFLTRIYKVAYSLATHPLLASLFGLLVVCFSNYSHFLSLQAKRTWHVIFSSFFSYPCSLNINVLQNLPVKCFFQQSRGNEKNLPASAPAAGLSLLCFKIRRQKA